MKATDVPVAPQCHRAVLPLAPMLAIAGNHGRCDWKGLFSEQAWSERLAGIYLVRRSDDRPPDFLPTAGKATHAEVAPPELLARKWQAIVARKATDVLYVGRGTSLRERLRLLAMFGAGRVDNHKGGEWLWQIDRIEASKVVLITCPRGKQAAFENSFLQLFEKDHGAYPLANRKGPEGQERWWPGDPS
jgi:hypothetical protein